MDKYEALKRYFGHAQFRPGQEALVDALLSGRDGLLEPSSPITRAEICKALVVMQNNY